MGMLVAVLWIISNVQLIYIVCKLKKEAWLILRTTPNRYLFSLLFLPIQMIINIYCLQQLCALLPGEHILFPFLTPYLITIYTISFSLLFTAIDFYNGNAGYTDLKYPYNISIIRARDAILEKIVSDNEWKCSSIPDSPVPLDDKSAGKIARNNVKDISILVNYVRRINKKVKDLTDNQQWSLNLFNVIIFVASVFWTIGCCLLLYVYKKMGLDANQPQHFDILCNLQLVSVTIIVLWLQFRAYEFAEFSDIDWRSSEQLDLWFAGFVITACLFLIAAAKSSTDPLKLLGFVTIFISMYNLKVRQHVREFCGSWMSTLNFVVIAILVLLIATVLCVIIFSTTK